MTQADAVREEAARAMDPEQSRGVVTCLRDVYGGASSSSSTSVPLPASSSVAGPQPAEVAAEVSSGESEFDFSHLVSCLCGSVVVCGAIFSWSQ